MSAFLAGAAAAVAIARTPLARASATARARAVTGLNDATAEAEAVDGSARRPNTRETLDSMVVRGEEIKYCNTAEGRRTGS
jgi:hypothetical protein